MKVAIPTANQNLCLHFGHCETFTLFDIDEDQKVITNMESLVPPPHEPGVLPKWLAEKGAQVIIAGGMGMRAQQLFTNAGVQVIVGASPEAPEKVAEQWMNGTLKTGDNTCDH